MFQVRILSKIIAHFSFSGYHSSNARKHSMTFQSKIFLNVSKCWLKTWWNTSVLEKLESTSLKIEVSKTKKFSQGFCSPMDPCRQTKLTVFFSQTSSTRKKELDCLLLIRNKKARQYLGKGKSLKMKESNCHHQFMAHSDNRNFNERNKIN